MSARRRLIPLLAAVGLLAGSGVLSRAGAADHNSYTLTTTYIRSADGTPLHTWVWRPAALPADARTPVLVGVSPYSTSVQRQNGNPGPAVPPSSLVSENVFARGYTVVQVTLRGFGGSGGCADLGGPGEQSDARAAVSWAAAQPWSNGRVGMFGGSYDGWTQLMAAADPPAGLVAVAPGSALTSLYTNELYTNGVAHRNLQKGFALTYLALDLAPSGPDEGPEGVQHMAEAQAARPGCGTEGLLPTLLDNDPANPYFVERDLVPGLRGSDLPMFITHGFGDFRVRPTFLDYWPTLTGQRHLWIGQHGHNGGSGKPGRNAALMAFFDRYVKGIGTGPDPEPTVSVEEGAGRWRAEAAWPPADARPTTFPILPGSYLDVVGNHGEANEYFIPTDPSRVPVAAFPSGQGSWTFTEPFPHDAHLAGAPAVSMTVETSAPDANVIALLYDVDADGNATLINRGAYLIPTSGQYDFRLWPQDWRIAAGHRLGLLLSGSDINWYEPVSTGTEVQVRGGSLSVDFVRFVRDRFVEGSPSSHVGTRLPFQVESATIAARTAPTAFPPRMKNNDCWQAQRSGSPCRG